MNRTRWLLGSVLLGAILTAGCRNKVALIKPDPPEVFWSHPVTRVINDYEEFTGKTDAINTVDLKSELPDIRKLTQVNFRDGSEVREGELLAVLNPDPYIALVRQGEAEVAKQEANKVLAEANFVRISKLAETKNETQENLDAARAALDTANPAIESAKQQLETARLNLRYTRVLAPFDGKITRRLVDVGNMVKNGDTVLGTLVSQDPIYGYFDVDERTKLKLDRLSREGMLPGWTPVRHWYRPLRMPVRLGLSNEEGFPHAGVIDYLSPRADTGTGTVQMRAVFPNPVLDDGNRALQPGLFARIQLPIGPPRSALLVPESALGAEQGRRFLYVLGPDEPYEDKAGKPRTKAMPQKVEVEVGTKVGNLIVIERVINPPTVKLTAESRVVITGLQRIQEKAPVTTTPLPEEPKPAGTSGPAFTPPVNVNKEKL